LFDGSLCAQVPLDADSATDAITAGGSQYDNRAHHRLRLGLRRSLAALGAAGRRPALLGMRAGQGVAPLASFNPIYRVGLLTEY
jgi:hypothetical protein